MRLARSSATKSSSGGASGSFPLAVACDTQAYDRSDRKWSNTQYTRLHPLGQAPQHPKETALVVRLQSTKQHISTGDRHAIPCNNTGLPPVFEDAPTAMVSRPLNPAFLFTWFWRASASSDSFLVSFARKAPGIPDITCPTTTNRSSSEPAVVDAVAHWNICTGRPQQLQTAHVPHNQAVATFKPARRATLSRCCKASEATSSASRTGTQGFEGGSSANRSVVMPYVLDSNCSVVNTADI